MKLEGTTTIPAPRDLVWQHLMNPESLARALPGCERLQSNPDGSFSAELKVGIGAVRGSYHGRVEMLDPQPPESYRLRVEGKGAGGFVKGEGKLELSDDAAGTRLRYSGEAQVGGVIASVGQRLIEAAARQIVAKFFEAFTAEVKRVP
jgi:uncharacterized protein